MPQIELSASVRVSSAAPDWFLDDHYLKVFRQETSFLHQSAKVKSK